MTNKLLQCATSSVRVYVKLNFLNFDFWILYSKVAETLQNAFQASREPQMPQISGTKPASSAVFATSFLTLPTAPNMKEKSTARTVTEGNSDPKDMALAVEQVVCRWMLVSILATLKVSAISPSILITVLERPTTKNCQPNQPYTLLLHAHLLYPPLSSSSKS
ncbi:unnamed protein product [Allacma fusca]|uniref:Uncharacterized protein n=1 Tax=Allacma fusca TaxID=39272 RepID=A0A8J2L1N4_9HEXA|nr:unnamed protein product [Allacma fusca]